MPKPAAALIAAILLTMTVPLTFEFDVELVPPRKPAAIPAGCPPLLVRMVPELMLPAAPAVTVASAAAVIAVASLTASIPELPDVMVSPFDVVTAILPGP